MEWIVVDGLATLKFDLIFTLALAGLLLLVGYGITRRVSFLAQTNVPAPVIAGLLFAIIVLLVRQYGGRGVALDSSLRQPLQILFFTVIGYGATLRLLRAGGWRLGLLLLLATLGAVLQCAVGILIARAMGAPPALGVICGALTLTGGPATGLAFTAQFESFGIAGAASLIVAAATFGILSASLVANPVVTLLIRRFKLIAREGVAHESSASESAMPAPDDDGATRIAASIETPPERSLTPNGLLVALLSLLCMMGAGAVLGRWLDSFGITLPAYVGAMIVAAIARNIGERLNFSGVNVKAVEAVGVVALALFLVLALMDLKLWQLSGLALPALTILLVQICITILFALLAVFPAMGRDYEAAVTTSGYLGFGLGITPNAVANMETLARRFRPAPRSFLVVPLVGAFFIDFTNSLVITFFINLLR